MHVKYGVGTDDKRMSKFFLEYYLHVKDYKFRDDSKLRNYVQRI
jgi:hypothetical protein